MSVKVMSRVWTHSKCTGTELVTVLALADWADDDGWCWPSLKKLAEKTRVTTSRLCKILAAIEQETGELHRERSTGGRNKRTRYRVVVTENSVTENSVAGNSVAENSVIYDHKTVSQSTHALIRHRTINKSASSIDAADSVNPKPSSLNGGTPKKRKSSASPGQPGVREAIGAFHELYHAKFGANPDIVGGRDGKIISDLIKSHGVEEVQRLLKVFFERPPVSVEKNNKFTIPTFKYVYNELLAQSHNRKSEMKAYG